MLASFAMQESTCNPKERGEGGEVGMFQLSADKCPGGKASDECYDPETSTKIAAKFIKSQIENDANGNVFEMTGNYNGWSTDMSYFTATKAASSSCCRCQNNLDYVFQFWGGWMLGVDAYDKQMGEYFNLNVCVVEFLDMLEFVWNSIDVPSWSSVRTAMIRLPFLPTSAVLSIASNNTIVSPGVGLWPIPASLSTGSEYVKLADDFRIRFAGAGAVPGDLDDAMQCATAVLWNDRHERLVVGRGSVDAEPLRNSSISTLKALELYVLSGSGDLKSIYESTVGVEANERDESYRLEVPADASTATLIANSTLGLLRGLTTFTQLFYLSENIVYTFKAPIVINDRPAFPHRGILLDTSRNYFPKDDILLTIDAMAWTKLNVLHWHVVDSQSFPLQIPAFPELAEKGAYDSKSIYTVEDVKEVVKYAGSRGVDVMVEIDTPGHTTAIAESHPEHIACANAVPWVKYAHEPPAGQLRITSPETIKFTSELFSSVMQMFPSKYFSSGGDEVNFACYAHDPQTQSELKSSKKTLETALASYVEQTHSTITAAGKTPVVWEEMVLQHKINLRNDTVT
ncbi:N-acetyl-glucosamine-6-phosphate deacetylase, partial [Tulasnella sp. 427]